MPWFAVTQPPGPIMSNLDFLAKLPEMVLASPETPVIMRNSGELGGAWGCSRRILLIVWWAGSARFSRNRDAHGPIGKLVP